MNRAVIKLNTLTDAYRTGADDDYHVLAGARIWACLAVTGVTGIEIRRNRLKFSSAGIDKPVICGYMRNVTATRQPFQRRIGVPQLLPAHKILRTYPAGYLSLKIRKILQPVQKPPVDLRDAVYFVNRNPGFQRLENSEYPPVVLLMQPFGDRLVRQRSGI